MTYLFVTVVAKCLWLPFKLFLELLRLIVTPSRHRRYY